MFARATPFLLCVLACAPPATRPAAPPQPPVLEGAGEPFGSIFPEWTLKGTAADDTLVRLYLDDACRGPVWKQLSAEQLREGQTIELVAGTINVFTAQAVDEQGLTSECSAPVRVRFDAPPPPQRPKVSFTPELPTRETHFVFRGTAADAVTVRMFDNSSCNGQPLRSASVEDFASIGLGVNIAPNTMLAFSFDSLNRIDQASQCRQGIYLHSDQAPPQLNPQLRSPSPSPERRSYISLGYDSDSGEVFLGPGCTGRTLRTCSGGDCTLFEVEFPPNAVQAWSARARDVLGNETNCVNAPEPWQFEPDASVPTVELQPGIPLMGRAPVSQAMVYVFPGPDCLSLPGHELSTRQFLISGVYLEPIFGRSDGGVVSARGYTEPTWFDCSTSVDWY